MINKMLQLENLVDRVSSIKEYEYYLFIVKISTS